MEIKRVVLKRRDLCREEARGIKAILYLAIFIVPISVILFFVPHWIGTVLGILFASILLVPLLLLLVRYLKLKLGLFYIEEGAVSLLDEERKRETTGKRGSPRIRRYTLYTVYFLDKSKWSVRDDQMAGKEWYEKAEGSGDIPVYSRTLLELKGGDTAYRLILKGLFRRSIITVFSTKYYTFSEEEFHHMGVLWLPRLKRDKKWEH